MRALVIGGSGQIGGWLLEHLRARGHEAIGTYHSKAYPGLEQLNAAAPEAVKWLKCRSPEVVFYPAGFTWVDGCERDPARARVENVDQPLHIAVAAHEISARFVYYSTDYLFDGACGPYDEQAEPQPLNEYGRAKLDAEKALIDLLGRELLIIRTCWVFGPERQGKNFAYQVVRLLRQGKTLTCPSDQFANPSYGPDVAEASVHAVELGLEGVLHLAGPNWIARCDLARAIAASFSLSAELIVSHSSAQLGLGAPRPLAGGLKSNRCPKELAGIMKPLQSALHAFRHALGARSPWADPLAAEN